MVTKIRKQVYIEAEQELMLKDLSDRLGLSEAEIIRQAIYSQTQQLRRQRRDISAWQAEREFIQSLIDQGPISGGRSWTREDLYDR